MRFRGSRCLALLLALGFAAGCPGSGPADALAAATSALESAGIVSAEVTLAEPMYLPVANDEWLYGLTHNGQDFVALRDGNPARISRISGDGRVVDMLGVRLHDGPVKFDKGAIASDGSSVGVAWYANIDDDHHDLHVRLYDRELRGLGPALVLKSPAGWIEGVAIGASADQYLVAWGETLEWSLEGPRIYGLFARRVSAAGELLDEAPIEVLRREQTDFMAPRVSWDGENFMVMWTEGSTTSSQLAAMRVSPAGAVLEAQPAVLGPGWIQSDVCFVAGKHTVVWSSFTNSGPTKSDVFALHVNPDLSVVEAAPISVTAIAQDQSNPRCIPAGADTFIVWTDSNSSRAKLSARTLGATGSRGPILSISNQRIGGVPSVLATDGTQALALWLDGGTRIAADGTPLDADALRIRYRLVEQSTALVSVGPASVLITFMDQRSSSTALRMQRVGLDGTLIDASSQPLHQAGGALRAVASASDRRGHVVVFSEWASTPATERLQAIHVSLDGVASAPVLLAESEVNGTLGHLRIAASTDGYLVTFGDGAISALRVASDGTALGAPFALSESTSHQTHARVAFDGTDYVVMWEDDRQPPAALWMARVSTSGAVLAAPLRVTRGSVDTSDVFQVVAVEDGVYAVWGSWGPAGAQLQGTHFARDGFTEHEEGRPLAVPFRDPLLVSHGSRMTVLGTTDEGLFAARLDTQGRLTEAPVLVTPQGAYAYQGLAALPDGTAMVTYARSDELEVAPRVRLRTLSSEPLPPEPDAGSVDAAAAHDAGGLGPTPSDGGASVDAAMPADAAIERDAALPRDEDAGVPLVDAGAQPSPDGGSSVDAGQASEDDEPPSRTDGGHAPDGGSGKDTGCAVASAARGAERPLWLLLGLAGHLTWRRRRR